MCKHELDKEKTKQLPENNGFVGYGTRHYVCKKCGETYEFGQSDMGKNAVEHSMAIRRECYDTNISLR